MAGNAITDTALVEIAREALPFKLTGAQGRALGEILDDMAAPAPMARLLQVLAHGTNALTPSCHHCKSAPQCSRQAGSSASRRVTLPDHVCVVKRRSCKWHRWFRQRTLEVVYACRVT